MNKQNLDLTLFVANYLAKYKTMPDLDIVSIILANPNNIAYMQLLGNCACISFFGPARIKGPNDNVVTKGATTLNHIFNNTYIESLSTQQPIISEYLEFCPATPEKKLKYDYHFATFYHNNPQDKKFQGYLEQRLNALYTFYELISLNYNLFFTITLNEYDINNNHQPTQNFYNILSYLKHLNILDKVIFVQMQSTVNPNKIEWNNCWAENFDTIMQQYNLKAITILDAKFNDSGQTHNQFLQKVAAILKSE